VEAIISHPRMWFDRRIVYALELLAGVRTGEAAALRWRHYDPTKQPLGELLVAFAYSTVKGREKTTKTDSSKHIPVHPTLAAMCNAEESHAEILVHSRRQRACTRCPHCPLAHRPLAHRPLARRPPPTARPRS
jgi:hypothetical protein